MGSNFYRELQLSFIAAEVLMSSTKELAFFGVAPFLDREERGREWKKLDGMKERERGGPTGGAAKSRATFKPISQRALKPS